MNYRLIMGAALLTAWSGCSLAAQINVAEPSVLITATALRGGSLPLTVTAYGAVQSSPSAQQSITARAADTVGTVYVHEGDRVAAGAPLVQLTPSAQTIAAYKQAQSARHNTQLLVARTRKLLAQHLTTTQELANAEKADSDAQATLDALKAQGGGGPEILRAPFQAIVMRLSVSEGASVASGTPLLELARPEGLILRVGIMPGEARLVRVGDTVRVAALDGSYEQEATVARRGSVVEPASGLVSVDIALGLDRLFPGETAKAVITVGHAAGYVVPHAAILADDHGDPYVVQVDGTKARKVKVKIVAVQGDKTAIQGAELDAQQALVLSGNYQLDGGMSVRFADASEEAKK